MINRRILVFLPLVAVAVLSAQQPPTDDRRPGPPQDRAPGPGRGPGQGQPPPHGPGGGPGMGADHGPGGHGFHGGPSGKWWTDPALIQKLGLNADQQKKIDGIFQQSRLSLIDLNAALQKEEAVLEPLLEAEHPDEAKVLTQIDRIAQARAGLEKANARMLLGFRGVLTQEQWKKLQDGGPRPRQEFRR